MTDTSWIKAPTEPPGLDELNLVTMTIDVNIEMCLNLYVISQYIPIDEQVVGVKYRDVLRGSYSNKQEDKKFKNQCTFSINVGDKLVNTKLFNNGKMVNVGCKKVEHARITAEIILGHITNMHGMVCYSVPNNFDGKKIKKFFKDDIRKKFGKLYQLLMTYFEMDIDYGLFDPCKSADDAFQLFLDYVEGSEDNTTDIMYIYTVINILKSYYPEDKLYDSYNDPEFQYLLAIIQSSTSDDQMYIEHIFPSYLNNHERIAFTGEQVDVVLRNYSTNCGYYVNRVNLVDLMQHTDGVVECKYKKAKYPGVIIVYHTPTKDIKIIVFNTGKINITATRTLEQVKMGYDFINKVCTEHFDKLLLTNEYENKIREYESSLPDSHYVGFYNEQHYWLLNKQKILSHPRNTRILYDLGLIDKYKQKIPV